MNWVEAKITCESHGMILMAIKSQNEFRYLQNTFLQNMVSFNRNAKGLPHHYYIGGRKDASWYWIDDNSEINSEYWCPGEPNRIPNEDDCVDFMYSPGGQKFCLNDIGCRSTQYIHKFVCEKSDGQ
jgi:Lectin C-type domain